MKKRKLNFSNFLTFNLINLILKIDITFLVVFIHQKLHIVKAGVNIEKQNHYKI